MSLGRALEAKGDLNGEKLSFRRAIEIDPADGAAHWSLLLSDGSDLDFRDEPRKKEKFR